MGRVPVSWLPARLPYVPTTYTTNTALPLKFCVAHARFSVTMGIRTMPWSEWMELDESFSSHQQIRTFRVNHCGKTVLCVLPAREDTSVKVAGGAEAGSWFLERPSCISSCSG